MDAETTQAVRHVGNLQNIINQHRFLLEQRPKNEDAIYRYTSVILLEEFEEDISKVIYYIQVKLDWPLSYKRLLLHHIQNDKSDTKDRLNNIANFVFDPKSKIQQTYDFYKYFKPKFSSIERQYGSGVCSIFYLQYAFFLINILTLILWLSLITIPYKILISSTTFSNVSFTFSSLFTTKGYLSESIFFQGSYPYGIINNSYNLSLIYFITTYIYFFIWFIYLTICFSSAYKEKVFNSILNTKLGIGFTSTFSKWNYTIKNDKDKLKHMKIFQREFFDLIENDERIKQIYFDKYHTKKYKFKLIITNLFYIILAIGLGIINWIILSYYSEEEILNSYGSIIFLALINRLMPYVIVMLTQIEQYKYLSYKLNAVGCRCILLNISTISSFIIYFFINKPSCYETKFGQFIYILLLSDLFASLIFPFLFGLLFDIILGKKSRDFDGINIHVQISPPILLYSQFLVWIGIYFSPLLSVMVILNILFSYISHRLYLLIRSGQIDSNKRVYIWNAYRLEYIIYLLGYILLIVSATCFAIFTTQIKPSENCGPFRNLDTSYEVIGNFLKDYQTSVLWVSIINFLTSPGFIYFLGITFFIIAYKLKHEGLAEKQLVFIRENNLESKKHLRQNAVKKLHRRNKLNLTIQNNENL